MWHVNGCMWVSSQGYCLGLFHESRRRYSCSLYGSCSRMHASKQVSCRQLLQQVLRTSVSMPGRRKPPLVQCVVCGEQYRSRYRGCNPRCSAHRPSAAPADSLLPDELSRLQLDPVPSVDDWSITGRKYGEALGLLHAAVPAPYSRTHSKEDAVVIANVLLPR